MIKIFNFKFSIFKSKQAFTLIELLMVITIIGILTTVVLQSLSQSRTKAYDSKLKQQLDHFRAAAEMYFLNQLPTGYGPAVSNCTTPNTLFTDMKTDDGKPALYVDRGNLPPNTQVVCGSTDSGPVSAYAVKATLFSGTEYWCVDSKGISKQFSGPIGNSATECPP
jgi:prepilin-type N-terminal cleavage/methylation domain-containing protein